jgi:hypothetical protein
MGLLDSLSGIISPIADAFDPISGLLSGAASMVGTQMTNSANAANVDSTNAANMQNTASTNATNLQIANAANAQSLANQQAAEAYNTQMSNTSYQRGVADLQAAGLNPMLAYTRGGASTPTVSAAPVTTATMVAPQMHTFQQTTHPISSFVSGAHAGQKLYNETRATTVDNELKDKQVILTQEQAQTVNKQLDLLLQDLERSKQLTGVYPKQLELGLKQLQSQIGLLDKQIGLTTAHTAQSAAQTKLIGTQNRFQTFRNQYGDILPRLFGGDSLSDVEGYLNNRFGIGK